MSTLACGGGRIRVDKRRELVGCGERAVEAACSAVDNNAGILLLADNLEVVLGQLAVGAQDEDVNELGEQVLNIGRLVLTVDNTTIRLLIVQGLGTELDTKELDLRGVSAR